MNRRRGFTLVELLIVIAIVAVLATAVTLVLNPAELLRESRDSTRLTDLASLKKALILIEGDQTGISLGSSSTVYVSLPDTSPTCANLGLPALPTGYSYGCVPISSFLQTDGTGWIPVNFRSFSGGTILSKLPIDPVNNSSFYYTYIPGGSWEITSVLESDKYRSQTISDGDPSPDIYSVRSSSHPLTPANRTNGLVLYHTFDGSNIRYVAGKSSSTDSSGNGNNGLLISGFTPDKIVSGKIGQAGNSTGNNTFEITIPASTTINNLSQLSISVWFKRSSLGGNNRGQIINKGGGYNGTVGWGLGENASGNMFFRVLYSGSTSTQRAANLPTDNTWHHLVVTWDGTSDATGIKFYLDTTTPTYAYTRSSAGGTYLSDAATPLQIGESEGASWYLGSIDDVRLYNRELSSSEILNLYNASR